MSLALEGAAPAAGVSLRLARSPLALALLGLALTLALQAPLFVAVWSDGRFFDTDDAMRLVELRDWLGGQSFGDLTQRRMNPAAPLAMHWSRVLDIPLAALRLAFGVFTDAASAERLTRLAFPLALQFGFFLALARLAIRLGASPLAAVLLGVASWATMAQFAPGRIDHHSAQILLLALMTLAACEARRPGNAWRAAIAGALAMLSLAISVENLPFVAALAGGLCLIWILDPRDDGAALKSLAFGLAGASLAARLFIPSSTPDPDACDALSRFHLVAAAAGAALVYALAAFGGRLQGQMTRAAAAALGAAILAAGLRVAFPACFGDPLAGVDPLLREIWLSHVSEARPLAALLARRPDMALPLLAPLALGLAAAILAARGEVGERWLPGPWMLVTALIAAGCLVSMWQVRAAASALPFVALAGAWIVSRLAARTEGGGPLARLAPTLAALPFAGLVWMSVLPAPKAAAGAKAADACFAPSAYAALATLKPGLVLSSLDAGSYVLAHTPHSVLAGAYHRNNSGNRRAIETLLAPPDEARRLARAAGVDYVAICPAMQDVEIYADRAPRGLAAMLRAGATPDWLEPLDVPGPFRIFRPR